MSDGRRPTAGAGLTPEREGDVSAGVRETVAAWLPADYGAPLLVVLSGPTAVGKTSVLRRMRELCLPWHIAVTATTRPAAAGEIDGADYYFLSAERFQEQVAAGEFLEYALVHGMHHYGIPRAPLRTALAEGADVIVPPDVQGAATVRALLPGAVTIFLAAPSFADLEHRIRNRGREDEPAIQRRLATARAEMARLHEFDYLLINEDGQLDDTVWAIDAIIRAEKRRIARQPVVV